MQDTRYPVGEPIKVLYRTDQVSSVKVDDAAGLWLGPIALIAVGAFFAALAGLFLWRWTRPAARAHADLRR